MRGAKRNVYPTARQRRGVGIRGVAVLALLLLSGAELSAQAAEESPFEDTDQAVDPMGNTAAGPFKEPQVDSGRELEAIVAAFLGEPFDDKPDSEVIAATIAELKATPPPEDEVFALVTVTDRHTGERRMFTRGFPKPEIAQYLADPSSAPKGYSYSEGDDIAGTEKVEIVVRSVSEHTYTPPKNELTRDEEEERDLKERNTGMGLSHRIEQGLRQRIKSGEIDLTTSKAVPVSITLKAIPTVRLPKAGDVVVDGLLWVGLDIQAERELALIARKGLVKDLQAETVADIEGLGGGVQYASWASGQIEAEVPAKVIPILADRDDVFSLEYVEPLTMSGFTGNEYYEPTNYQDFDPVHVGRNGVQSKHGYTSRIVMALSEDCIDRNSPAWNDGPGGASRGWFYDCDAGDPCTPGIVDCSAPLAPGTPLSAAHATMVAGLMVADFMNDQDTAVSALNQRRMTGTCPDCKFFFFQDQGLNNRQRALDAACNLGVDIFESSINGITTSCDGNGWYDAAVQSLVDCDAVYVQAAANRGSNGGCSTAFPADHPWTFTVGGMMTDDPCDTASAYFTSDCIYDEEASRGGGVYNTYGTASIIDQTAPYRHGALINPLSANPVTRTSADGTSGSAPLVAGLMADMMDWYRQHVSTSIFFNNRMRNFMLLFGDRSVRPEGTRRALNYHDVRWGSGRTVLFPFDDEDGWNMRRRSRTLASDTEWVFDTPVSPNASFFKAVVWHDGRDYQSEPQTRLRLEPRGCNSPAPPTRTASRLDSKAMVAYEIALDGCAEVRVRVKNIRRAGSGSRLYHYASLATDDIERNW